MYVGTLVGVAQGGEAPVGSAATYHALIPVWTMYGAARALHVGAKRLRRLSAVRLGLFIREVIDVGVQILEDVAQRVEMLWWHR